MDIGDHDVEEIHDALAEAVREAATRVTPDIAVRLAGLVEDYADCFPYAFSFPVPLFPLLHGFLCVAFTTTACGEPPLKTEGVVASCRLRAGPKLASSCVASCRLWAGPKLASSCCLLIGPFPSYW